MKKYWIDPLNAKDEITPWDDKKVRYKKYHCLDLEGGYWPSRAVCLVEYSEYEKTTKENKGLKYSNKELIGALKTLKEDLPWGQGDCLTKIEFIDITLEGADS